MNNRLPDSSIIHERREYFRVNDEVLLCFVSVEEEIALTAKIPQEFSNDVGFTLVKELQHIDSENHQLLRSIGHFNQDLQHYLVGLNKKLELITSQLIGSLAPQSLHQRRLNASLSENGFSFDTDKVFKIGGYLALQLFLLPAHYGLVLFGKVVHCTIADNGKYTIALEFVSLKETDRQVLAKHIMQVQLLSKRHQQ